MSRTTVVHTIELLTSTCLDSPVESGCRRASEHPLDDFSLRERLMPPDSPRVARTNFLSVSRIHEREPNRRPWLIDQVDGARLTN